MTSGNWYYVAALLPCQETHDSSVYVWAVNTSEALNKYRAMYRSHINEVIIVQQLNGGESERLEEKIEKDILHQAKRHGYVTSEEIVKPKIRFKPMSTKK